jgi:uncharacterized membrane protein YccC
VPTSRPARRERFLEFNWGYLVGLIAFVIGGWRAEGPWLVLGSLAAAGLVAGVWFAFWRRSQDQAN